MLGTTGTPVALLFWGTFTWESQECGAGGWSCPWCLWPWLSLGALSHSALWCSLLCHPTELHLAVLHLLHPLLPLRAAPCGTPSSSSHASYFLHPTAPTFSPSHSTAYSPSHGSPCYPSLHTPHSPSHGTPHSPSHSTPHSPSHVTSHLLPPHIPHPMAPCVLYPMLPHILYPTAPHVVHSMAPHVLSLTFPHVSHPTSPHILHPMTPTFSIPWLPTFSIPQHPTAPHSSSPCPTAPPDAPHPIHDSCARCSQPEGPVPISTCVQHQIDPPAGGCNYLLSPPS